MMYLVWSVVELPVELAGVEVGEEGLELAGRLHLGVVGEEVHVPEAAMDLSASSRWSRCLCVPWQIDIKQHLYLSMAMRGRSDLLW